MSEVGLTVNGKEFLGWKDITITRSLEALTAQFVLSYVDSWGNEEIKKSVPGYGSWYLKPGDACEITLDNELILTGYVDEVNTAYEGDDRSFSLSGRDKTGDIVDCSPSTSMFGDRQNQDIAQITRSLLSPFGLSLVVDDGVNLGKKFQRISIDHGSSVFDVLDQMSKMRGLLFTTDARGRVMLSAVGSQRAKIGLVEGDNILSARLTLDHSRRFKNYYVYGQSYTSDDQATGISRKVKASAEDASITRYRPKAILLERDGSFTEAKARAEWESAYNASKGTKLEVRVLGWRQGELVSEPLWKPNLLVSVIAPFLGVEGDLLIESVTYRLTESEGEVTELTLTKPDAWTANPIQKEETKQFLAIGEIQKVR